jgi:hypothetical protein
MSGPAPPEGGLAAARQALEERGYLGSSLPPPPPPLWRRSLPVFAFAIALAAQLAWLAVALVAGPSSAIVRLWLGFLPCTLILVAAGAGLGRSMGHGLLRLGGAPGRVATGLAGAGGGVVVGAQLAVANLPGRLYGAGVDAGLAAGLLLATYAVLAGRSALLAALAYRPPRSPRRAVGRIAAVTALAVAVLLVLTRRPGGEGAPAAAAAFPPPHGRVAVLAVDGLAREDLEAAAPLSAGAGLGTLAGWGWAPLEGVTAALPAVLWTTVACGVGPQAHGVTELEEVRLFGAAAGVPLSPAARVAVLACWRPLRLATVVARPALARKASTFWEMASRAGCPVTVGGWWGSWPVRRVLGEIASERAWLGGGDGPDAVTPSLVPLVQRAWRDRPAAAVASDELARDLAERAAREAGPRLLALYLPSMDLVRRTSPHPAALRVATELLRHLVVVGEIARSLEVAGFDVWVVAVPWGGGTPFVASSSASRGRHPGIAVRRLAATWVAGLGLPPPLGLPAPDEEFSGSRGASAAPLSYGPPPPPAASPPPAGAAVQREVLRNLGYLR